MRAAIYVRVSTDIQVEKGYSIESQLKSCRKKAEELGCEYDEYIDGGYSGSNMQRPELQKLLKKIKAGTVKYNYLILYKLDRLSRKTEEALFMGSMFTRQNIEIILAEGTTYGSSSQDKFMMSIVASVAEFENAQRSERSLKGRMEKRKHGRLDKNKKYGFTYNDTTQLYEINEEEAQWIRKIFNWYTNEGLSMYTICRRLNALKVPRTFNGKSFEWGIEKISRMLKDTGYVGIIYTMRETRKLVDGVKRRKTRDKSEWIPVQIPAIISKDLFEKTQALISAKTRKKMKSKKYFWLLQGLVFCADCHQRMYLYQPFSKRKGEKYRYRYYQCKANTLKYFNISKPCTNRNVPMHLLDEMVWDLLVKNFSDKEKIKEFMKKIKPEKTDDMALLEKVQNQYKKAQSSKEKILSWFTDGKISEVMADKKLDEVNAKIKDFSQQIKDLKEKIGDSGRTLTSDDFYERFNRIQHPTEEQKREIILSIINKIYVKRLDKTKGNVFNPKLSIEIVLL